MDDLELTERVRAHPDFLPQLRRYVEMARDRTMYRGMDIPAEDIELMRAESLRLWEPEIALLEARAAER